FGVLHFFGHCRPPRPGDEILGHGNWDKLNLLGRFAEKLALAMPYAQYIMQLAGKWHPLAQFLVQSGAGNGHLCPAEGEIKGATRQASAAVGRDGTMAWDEQRSRDRVENNDFHDFEVDVQDLRRTMDFRNLGKKDVRR